ncbi:bifunctional enzyme IspD/IspF [Synergistales bacterium]|nr:bifunctional enzyme IspD/IspF [Synergistales bacterium]
MAAGGTWAFVLMAAGSGSRMGGTPKQFRLLGGIPLWLWSARVAEGLYRRGAIDELIVVFPPGYDTRIIHELRCPVIFTRGSDLREGSVLNGIEAAASDYVLIHDAARPFLKEETCAALMGAASGGRGAVPLLKSVDSLKKIDGDKITPIPRENIFRTQTPQAFNRETLINLIKTSDKSATDEASMWADAGYELVSVPGDDMAFKITTQPDWMTASALANSIREARTGYGYDVHELVPGRKLVLGGVEIASPLGLLGHSDADVICHSMSDALLGAAGRGDIGTMFSASDERHKNMDSTLILERVLETIAEGGWRAVWIDITLIAQIPRLGRIMPDIKANLGKRFTSFDLADRISVKVKSGELIGSAGRGDCMICHAVATIERHLFSQAGDL